MAQVALQVVDQAHPVGVVGVDAVVYKLQRVGRTRQPRGFARIGGQLEGLQLERHRHVGAAPAFGAKARQRFGKAVQRGFDGGVAQVLRGGLGKKSVDQGRFAVGHRVADEGVAVCHGGRLSRKALARLRTSSPAYHGAHEQDPHTPQDRFRV